MYKYDSYMLSVFKWIYVVLGRTFVKFIYLDINKETD